jgi:hypothetical protein
MTIIKYFSGTGDTDSYEAGWYFNVGVGVEPIGPYVTKQQAEREAKLYETRRINEIHR